MDLIASSAVNLPITSASLRLVVVWMGVRSIRCTNSSGATTETVHSYNKFDVFHGLSCFHFTYGPYQFSVSCRALQAGESCFAMTDWPSLTAGHFSWSHSQLASSLL